MAELQQQGPAGELTDEQLDQVAGGLVLETLVGLGAVLLAGMSIADGPWGDIASTVGQFFDELFD